MDKQNLIGACLAQIKRLPRSDPQQASSRGWALTRHMLGEILRLPEPQRCALRGSLTREETGFLFGIAFGAAVDTVRETDPQYLREGLLALIIEGKLEDFRETVRHLSLLHHSAAKVGVDLGEIYQPLRPYASAEMASLIEGWLHEGTKDIGMMAYVEGTTKDGQFSYRSTLRDISS